MRSVPFHSSHKSHQNQYHNRSSFSSSNQRFNIERKHPLQSDIDERYGKKQKSTSGTASETNSLVTEEDNSSLHDDNLDGSLILPSDDETGGA